MSRWSTAWSSFVAKKGDTTDAEHIEGNTKLEIAWTIVPLFIVMIFAYLGAYSLAETRRVDPQAMVVNVTASQWAWSFEYPDYGFVSQELYLPKDRQVLLQMQSKDVDPLLLGARIPRQTGPCAWPRDRIAHHPDAGRRLQSPLRGIVRHIPCVHGKPGDRSRIRDFVAWATEQQSLALAAAQTPEGRGQQLVKVNACLGCHSIDGSSNVGPTWFGLFGSQVTLSDGTTVTADEAFIAESILNPQATIVAGFENQLMPNVYSTFTEEDLANIIAYIKTLK